MPRIRFPFDPGKFAQTVALLLHLAGPCTRLKLGKLVYLVDRYHLVRWGRPVVGGAYHALQYGPIPSIGLDVLEDLAALIEQSFGSPQVTWGYLAPLHELVDVGREGPHPSYRSRSTPKTDLLSETDQEAIRAVAALHGGKTPGDLVDLTHEHAAWKRTPLPQEIDYRLFFEDESGAIEEMKEYVEMTQEDRDLVDSLNG